MYLRNPSPADFPCFSTAPSAHWKWNLIQGRTRPSRVLFRQRFRRHPQGAPALRSFSSRLTGFEARRASHPRVERNGSPARRFFARTRLLSNKVPQMSNQYCQRTSAKSITSPTTPMGGYPPLAPALPNSDANGPVSPLFPAPMQKAGLKHFQGCCKPKPGYPVDATNRERRPCEKQQGYGNPENAVKHFQGCCKPKPGYPVDATNRERLPARSSKGTVTLKML